MERTCPQCNQALPKVDELQYRFCPHCGAQIDAGPRPLDEAFLTQPPDLPPPPVNAQPEDHGPAPEKTTPAAEPFEDQTAAPQPVTPENRPQIKPPDDPPPSSFFRAPPEAPDPPPPKSEKQQAEKVYPRPPEIPKKTATKTHHKVLIAVLIVLVLVVLLLGALFTF